MIKFNGLILFSLFVTFVGSSQDTGQERSFKINYEKNSFYMDGRPFRYVSGSAHYFRIPHQYWQDRLRKIRASGLNAVSTYVEWSLHESVKGEYNFEGDLNVKKFIEMAQDEGLYVILRPGPYICAERDLGGLPYWLLKYPNINLRSSDTIYKKYVEIWIDKLMKKLTPLLYGNGGPIIMVQVENEYGSYFKCDHNYTIWLRDLFKKHVKNNAVLFTTDGASDSFLSCGKIPGVYATVDFGPQSNVKKAFEAQRRFEPRGPLVNSEYYPGWLTHWGEKMARTGTPQVVQTLTHMLDEGANVNFYMFHGGTNFGFTAGANYFEEYQSDITSYDYDAPISEAGDLTEKYEAIRKVVFQYLSPTNITVNSSKKGNYGEITLTKVATMLSPAIRKKMGVLHLNKNPQTFEKLDLNFGYVLYETRIPAFNFSSGNLVIEKIGDLAHVYKNGRFLGNMSRESKTDTVLIHNLNEGEVLSIVVENLGRINFGKYIKDEKGILSPVTLTDTVLRNWNMTTFGFTNTDAIKSCWEESNSNQGSECDNGQGFAFFYQIFKLPQSERGRPLDSFLDVSHLTKGLVFINGYNLGRYWSWRGPQYTLYVPGVYLKPYPEDNEITVMDENIQTDSIKIKFTQTPIFS